MRALSRRPKEYADEQADPTRPHDLRMSAELLQHLSELDHEIGETGRGAVRLGAAMI
jgi:hypothetical protein